MAEVLGQACDGLVAVGFVLQAVYTRQRGEIFSAVYFLRGNAGNRVHTDCGACVLMGQRNFEAIREARKINLQMRMLPGQMLERFQARFDDRGLQPGGGLAFETGGIRKETGYATRRRSQPGVGVNAQVQDFGFSGHGL